jgi:hypothetical protein
MSLDGVGSGFSFGATPQDYALDFQQVIGNAFAQINDNDPNDANNNNSNQASSSNSSNTANANQITLAQFQQAFNSLNLPQQIAQLGPTAIFSALDPNGTGSVSKSEFVSGLTQLRDDLNSGIVRHGHGTASAGSEDDGTQLSPFQLISQVLANGLANK